MLYVSLQPEREAHIARACCRPAPGNSRSRYRGRLLDVTPLSSGRGALGLPPGPTAGCSLKPETTCKSAATARHCHPKKSVAAASKRRKMAGTCRAGIRPAMPGTSMVWPWMPMAEASASSGLPPAPAGLCCGPPPPPPTLWIFAPRGAAVACGFGLRRATARGSLSATISPSMMRTIRNYLLPEAAAWRQHVNKDLPALS